MELFLILYLTSIVPAIAVIRIAIQAGMWDDNPLNVAMVLCPGLNSVVGALGLVAATGLGINWCLHGSLPASIFPEKQGKR